MRKRKFENVAIQENNDKYSACIFRDDLIYKRNNDIRSEFNRDYNRILHSNSYRRLKHKTQVFFATNNDHICTRMEHVGHVSSVSYSIANYLGLNTELTMAISIGHDIGHPPFGHDGERVLSNFTSKKLNYKFWHEKNSLRFADVIETLPTQIDEEINLDLTYAVRDGIICHCGEVKSKPLFPRENKIDLNLISKPGQVSPYTWEGCVVKISDKISYLGRDIEDALRLKILTQNQIKELNSITEKFNIPDFNKINNTVIVHNLVTNLCENSSIKDGITLSNDYFEFMDSIKAFCYKNIYYHSRLSNFQKYVELVINTILETIDSMYDGINTLKKLDEHYDIYPNLCDSFSKWLIKYSTNYKDNQRGKKYNNKKIYNLENKDDYYQSIVDYVSSMTDAFAIKIFNEILQF
ncbi:deoxyguanosinetriphosphate triphosphohydrolase family protein [Romboutsia sp. 1001713B170207_170306_H8]|uniref:deoxyguanosinetriphosphate triphosphohydrolase family protein n=1 Tax=Romboutsia sp. 1001713B170207_170306_H8 TaxID=2787112 RepID=UPI00082254C6|nr:HD domain-containing protein [Romboutsia sp. 1001713B170207_170306_H8]SCH66881.1 Deoxyguanosinetriphosphate triphosphohydrolase [uncultured Clostridium sp.]